MAEMMTLDEYESLPWEGVKSSNLARVAWLCSVEQPQNMAEAEFGRLWVEFHYGALYAYTQVPKDFYEELRDDDSPGAYLNAEIKPHFGYERIRVTS